MSINCPLDIPTKFCYTNSMPKEPKIAQMDWRILGYWPVWKDGKKVWVPKERVEDYDTR